MRHTKSTLRVLWLLIVAVLAVVSLTFVIASAVLSTDLTDYHSYIVHTGSMEPTVPSGSAVLVRKGDFHVGQVVSFYKGGQVISHRLMKHRSDGSYLTKGDADRSYDPWVTQKADIIGGVVWAPNYVGYLMQFCSLPFGKAAIFLVLLLLLNEWPAKKSENDQTATQIYKVTAPS